MEPSSGAEAGIEVGADGARPVEEPARATSVAGTQSEFREQQEDQ